MKFNDGSSTFVRKQFVQLINNAASECVWYTDGEEDRDGRDALRSVLRDIIHHAVYTVGTMDGDDRNIIVTVIEPNIDALDGPGPLSEIHRFEFVLHNAPGDRINHIVDVIATPNSDVDPTGYVHAIE